MLTAAAVQRVARRYGNLRGVKLSNDQMHWSAPPHMAKEEDAHASSKIVKNPVDLFRQINALGVWRGKGKLCETARLGRESGTVPLASRVTLGCNTSCPPEVTTDKAHCLLPCRACGTGRERERARCAARCKPTNGRVPRLWAGWRLPHSRYRLASEHLCPKPLASTLDRLSVGR